VENGAGGSGSYIPFFNDLEETKAWIHESIAIITEPTRKITSSFYKSPPRNSYYHGCSTGGAQGFALAQFHPHLFDGIYAGSPGNWYSHLMLSFLWNGQQSKVSLPWSLVLFISFCSKRIQLIRARGMPLLIKPLSTQPPMQFSMPVMNLMESRTASSRTHFVAILISTP
jgi:hypothetical protein